jgi:hypothetical protein
LIKDSKSPNFISLATFKPAAVLDFIHEVKNLTGTKKEVNN